MIAIRQFEDYVVIPRVMGHVTGLSPLLGAESWASAIGLLFGGFYVLLGDAADGRAGHAAQRDRAR